MGDDSETPHMAAAMQGHTEVLKLFLSKGADLMQKDVYADGLLHKAAQDSLETTKFLLDKKVFDIEETDNFGLTPLHLAAFNGKADIIKHLLSVGANIEVKDQKK